MVSDKKTEFLLWVTKFLHGHWEDPEWGRKVSNQIMFKQAIYEISENIEDSKMRNEIQKIDNRDLKSIK